jgi:hypothetical protein
VTDSPAPRSRASWVIAAVVAVLALVGAILAWALAPRPESAAAPTPSLTRVVTPTPTPTPSPTPTGFPADPTAYPLDGLPSIDVYAVIGQLPVDPDPFGPLPGDLARAVAAAAPVFAEPGTAPVAVVPRDHHFDGTTLPVIERQEHWVRVLLTGRQAMPSAGDPGQLTGWLRVQDVELSRIQATVEVDIAARTVDIVHLDGNRERVADDFGWGTDATPTPRGRAFVMMVRTEPSFTYTRGQPLVYLSVQSPTLDGFGGAPVAVTAFHYHDVRSGPISNGCIRTSAEAVQRLGQLPVGTPVYIR